MVGHWVCGGVGLQRGWAYGGSMIVLRAQVGLYGPYALRALGVPFSRLCTSQGQGDQDNNCVLVGGAWGECRHGLGSEELLLHLIICVLRWPFNTFHPMRRVPWVCSDGLVWASSLALIDWLGTQLYTTV